MYLSIILINLALVCIVRTDTPDEARYKKVCLDGHNTHRKNHSAPSLTWNDQATESALAIVETCMHTDGVNGCGSGYGQNIGWWGSSSIESYVDISTVNVTINDWYNGQVEDYDENYDKDTPDVFDYHFWGAFTQVVWNSTSSIGCATNLCSTNDPSYFNFFTACCYEVGGNVDGAYAANVGRPLGYSVYDPVIEEHPGS